MLLETVENTVEEQKSCSKHNQSTESADGDGCLKFYRPLELIGNLCHMTLMGWFGL